MDVGEIIERTRREAGLTQRELAARAGTSAAAICLYERGERVPRVDTLARIVAAAGAVLEITVSDGPIDKAAHGRVLAQLLDLADHLPRRAAGELKAPVFRDLASWR